LPGEVVIDKPGKGSFWNTPIMHALKARGITHLLVSGVTTECCFSTSIREANDRGFECCGIIEATSGYNPAFKTASLEMIYWSQGLFGFVAELQPLLDVLVPSGVREFSTLTTPPQTPPMWDGDLSINGLRVSYRDGLSPITVAEAVYDRIEKCQYFSSRTCSHRVGKLLIDFKDMKVDPAVWIYLVTRNDVLAAAQNLVSRYPDKKRLPPLFGVPFNVKDSIDIAGLETTTACPPLAYMASKSARCYELVADQGMLTTACSGLWVAVSKLKNIQLPKPSLPVTNYHYRRTALWKGQPRPARYRAQWLQESIRHHSLCLQRQTYLRRQLEW
jgi:hypothetical protein